MVSFSTLRCTPWFGSGQFFTKKVGRPPKKTTDPPYFLKTTKSKFYATLAAATTQAALSAATFVATVVTATVTAITAVAAIAAATVVAAVTRYFNLYCDTLSYWHFFSDLNWNADLICAGLFFRNTVINSYRVLYFFLLWNHNRVGDFLGHSFRYTLANLILTSASLSSALLYLYRASSLFWDTLGDTVGTSSLFWSALLYLNSASSLFWDTLGDTVGAGSLFCSALLYLNSASSLFWNTLGDTVGASSLFWNVFRDAVSTSSLFFTALRHAYSASSLFCSALSNTNGVRNFFGYTIICCALNFFFLTCWNPNPFATHFWWARIATRICATRRNFGHLVFPVTTTNLYSLC